MSKSVEEQMYVILQKAHKKLCDVVECDCLKCPLNKGDKITKDPCANIQSVTGYLYVNLPNIK
jgi:hypothetical protein